MLEALVKSGSYQQGSEFIRAQATSDLLFRRGDAFANPNLQKDILGGFSLQHLPESFMMSCLSGEQRAFKSEFVLTGNEEEKSEAPARLNLSPADFKNVVLLGEVKSLLSKGELVKARQSLERALIAGQKFSDPLLKLNDALALEKVVTRSVTSPDRKSEATWIKTNRAAYKGKWVAVLGEQVVASGDTFKEVLAAIKQKGLSLMPVIHHVD